MTLSRVFLCALDLCMLLSHSSFVLKCLDCFLCSCLLICCIRFYEPTQPLCVFYSNAPFRPQLAAPRVGQPSSLWKRRSWKDRAHSVKRSDSSVCWQWWEKKDCYLDNHVLLNNIQNKPLLHWCTWLSWANICWYFPEMETITWTLVLQRLYYAICIIY